MELVVDLATAVVTLRDPEVFTAFAVRALPGQAGDGAGTDALGALAAALSVHDAGWVDQAGNVFVPPDAVRSLAAAALSGGTVDTDWDAGFRAMVEHAATKGWIADDGSIQAHVEWESG